MHMLKSINNGILKTSFAARMVLRAAIIGVATLIAYQFLPHDSYYTSILLIVVALFVGASWWREDEKGSWRTRNRP